MAGSRQRGHTPWHSDEGVDSRGHAGSSNRRRRWETERRPRRWDNESAAATTNRRRGGRSCALRTEQRHCPGGVWREGGPWRRRWHESGPRRGGVLGGVELPDLVSYPPSLSGLPRTFRSAPARRRAGVGARRPQPRLPLLAPAATALRGVRPVGGRAPRRSWSSLFVGHGARASRGGGPRGGPGIRRHHLPPQPARLGSSTALAAVPSPHPAVRAHLGSSAAGGQQRRGVRRVVREWGVRGRERGEGS